MNIQHSKSEGWGGRSNNRSFVAKALSQHFSFRRDDKISYTPSFSHAQCLRIVIRGCATEYASPRIEELVGTLVSDRRVSPTNYVESKHKLKKKEWLINASLQWLELLQLLKQNAWIPKIGSANCPPIFGLKPHPTHCMLELSAPICLLFVCAFRLLWVWWKLISFFSSALYRQTYIFTFPSNTCFEVFLVTLKLLSLAYLISNKTHVKILFSPEGQAKMVPWHTTCMKWLILF